MKRVLTVVVKVLFTLIAIGLAVLVALYVMRLIQAGPFAPTAPEIESAPNPITRMSSPVTEIPEDSVLYWENNEGGAKLIADMNEGKIPTACNVLYDQMGSRPAVTVTDPGVITALYNYLAHVRVTGKEGSYITDSYHHVSFALQDGTYVTFRFEGGDLAWGAYDYETTGSGPLWTLVCAIQDDYLATLQED